MSLLEVAPHEFRRLAAEVTEIAADYLSSLDLRPVFPKTSGEETRHLFQAPLPEDAMGAKAFTYLHDVVGHSRAQNGRFFGYVLGSGELVGAIADLLASVLNQNVTAWRSAPAAVTLERTVVSWLAEAIGCAGFQGSLTGGGSLANLMGLAMAREAKAPANERGLAKECVLYASEEVHMSIPKSVALLGMGRENLRLIPTVQDFRLIPAELEKAIQADKAVGKTAIAVVAAAGTVHTGDYAKSLSSDPIEGFAVFEESIELSRRFRALKLWLSLRFHGMRAFRDVIRKNMELATRLGAAVANHPEFELLAPVELSAVCFRHRVGEPATDEELNRHNSAILKRLVERGRVYLSNTTVRGTFALRACIVNHGTTDADVDSVIPDVLAAAGARHDQTQP